MRPPCSLFKGESVSKTSCGQLPAHEPHNGPQLTCSELKAGLATQLQQRTPLRRCALGSGGNRTLVLWTVTVRATTVPETAAQRLPPCRVRWATRAPPPGLCQVSAVFPAASRLSGRHPPLLLPGCGEQAPGAIAGPCFTLPDLVQELG